MTYQKAFNADLMKRTANGWLFATPELRRASHYPTAFCQALARCARDALAEYRQAHPGALVA